MPHCHTLIEALRQKGYRLTPQREMVVEAIAHSSHHVTAEDLFAQVQARTRAINIATVYRTLDLLVETGLVSRIDLGDGRLVYATVRHGPHIHLVCRHCGYVIEAGDGLIEPLGRQFQERYGFAADLQHVSIFGLCAGCQSASWALG